MTLRDQATEIVKCLIGLGHTNARLLPRSSDTHVELRLRAHTNMSVISPEDIDIEIDDIRVGMRVVRYGTQKGRVDYQGYVPYSELAGLYDRPTLGSTQRAASASPMTVAKAIDRLIIFPSVEPMEEYRAILARNAEARNSLPVRAEALRSYGATVHEPRNPSAGEASFSYRAGDASLSGEMRSNGAVSLRNAVFTHEQIIAVMIALRDLEKSQALVRSFDD